MSPRLLTLIEFLTIIGLVLTWILIVFLREQLGYEKGLLDAVGCASVMCLSGMFGTRFAKLAYNEHLATNN